MHALLSASGAKRWISCPPSARLEEPFPDMASEYATKGTLAHRYAEYLINRMQGEENVEEYNAIVGDPLYDIEMERTITEFKDYIEERLAQAGKDALLLSEQKLSYDPWVPEGFGTGDVTIISTEHKYVEVIDLKYGTGVSVSALDNPQLHLYGLGALNEYEFLYDVDKVIMTIVQPRLDSISSQEKSVPELLAWGRSIVDVAKLAFAGEGEYKAGDHCQFCKAKAICKARVEENLKLMKYEFRTADVLADEEIGEILKKADQLRSWAEDIKNYALTAAKNGKKFEGWKLVEGRSNRKFTDEKRVEKTLLDAGYTEHALYKPVEMQSLSNLERTIGKKKFNELLSDWIEKPPGKPTLVPDLDKRPEMNSIDEDFEVLD